MALGEPGAARAAYEASLRHLRAAGNRAVEAATLRGLGHIAVTGGDLSIAAGYLAESLAIRQDLRHMIGIAGSLAHPAAVAAARGCRQRAARPLGAAEAMLERTGAQWWPETQTMFARTREAVRADLSTEAFAAAWTAGRAWTVEDAVAEALAATAAPAPPPATVSAGRRRASGGIVYPNRLTAREVETLRLLAGGKSSPAIAGELVSSTVTVERHVANIHTKIGARTRVDATAYEFRQGLL